ncbi:2-hydroxychromene-2-carboxylate isomerase [Solimonas sp. SE-A11]|uniref:2-hydroxychromene-2-carboxylate isomerase n=1 Tax=Solimonas sp. SE-A11 TaxID=3054954 RepID=UPI00259CD5D2|nr:2-hydroxychromene-2-carboxylate isomerase [Solimonas sp. SE-A11]MDM4769006.1 2-hydroxychromene-2-carboxylate isomerase [Solimonas sp. SE-A11]
MKLQFWFEFASTYSYLTAMRVEQAAAQAGVELEWRVFLLGPIFKSQGWNDSPFNLYPVKGQYMWRDMERGCEKLGLSLRRPSTFPRNGLLAARVACRFSGEPWLPAFVRAVYTANFAQDHDIADAAVIADCLVQAGVSDAATVLTAAQAPESKQKLATQTDEAIRLGVFGAPSLVAGSELFWGNDRLEDALAWAKR